jgi:WD40 repeat protein/GTPase SAR1 family protein
MREAKVCRLCLPLASVMSAHRIDSSQASLQGSASPPPVLQLGASSLEDGSNNATPKSPRKRRGTLKFDSFLPKSALLNNGGGSDSEVNELSLSSSKLTTLVVCSFDCFRVSLDCSGSPKQLKAVCKLIKQAQTSNRVKAKFAFAHGPSSSDASASHFFYGQLAPGDILDRMNVPLGQWAVCTANSDFALAPSYPSRFILPAPLAANNVAQFAALFPEQRLPALLWMAPPASRRATLSLGSAAAGFAASSLSSSAMSARPALLRSAAPRDPVAAAASAALGEAVHVATGGTRLLAVRVDDSARFFLSGDGDDVAAVVQFNALRTLCIEHFRFDGPAQWRDAVARTGWHASLLSVLGDALRIARQLGSSQSVWLQSTRGGVELSLLGSLVVLLLDVHYRTARGLASLLVEHWTAWGLDTQANGRQRVAAVALLDIVGQLVRLAPSAFDFDDRLLLFVAQSLTSCQFGNFLRASERQLAADARSLHVGARSLLAHLSATAAHWLPYDRDFVTQRANVIECAAQPLVDGRAAMSLWSAYFLQSHAPFAVLGAHDLCARQSFIGLGIANVAWPLHHAAAAAGSLSADGTIGRRARSRDGHAAAAAATEGIFGGANTRQAAEASSSSSSSPSTIASSSSSSSSSSGGSSLARRRARVDGIDLSGNLFDRTPCIDVLMSHNGKIGSMRRLSMAGNALASIDDSFFRGLTARWPALVELNLSDNFLFALPPSIGMLQRAHVLKLSSNQLDSLPSTVAYLSQLEYLSLADNRLATLPDALFESLRWLATLDVSRNALSSLPPFAMTGCLRSLDISHNAFAVLPAGVERLPALRHLIACNNQLRDLPFEWGAARSLDTLDLSHNAIHYLPATLAALAPRLSTLIVEANRLHTVPVGLLSMRSIDLRSLAATNATLYEKHLTRRSKGTDGSDDDDDVQWPVVRALIVGDANCGKTTLLARLLGGGASSSSSLVEAAAAATTTGMDVHRLSLSRADVELCDFGGAPAFHPLQQLALEATRRCLYIVVFNPCEADWQRRVEYFVRLIDAQRHTAARSERARIVLVATHHDECEESAREHLFRSAMSTGFLSTVRGIRAHAFVSSTTGVGVDRLRRQIDSLIAHDGAYLRPRVPAAYVQLRSLLLHCASMRRRMLSVEQLHDMLAACGVPSTPGEHTRAIDFLRGAGCLTRISQRSYVIDVQWIAKMMGTLLAAAEPALSVDRLIELWADYSPETRRAALDLLAEFELVIERASIVSNVHIIVPSLLALGRPDSAIVDVWPARGVARLRRICQFRFVPEGLFSRLLVRVARLDQRIELLVCWRDGAVLGYAGAAFALVEFERASSAISWTLCGGNDSDDQFDALEMWRRMMGALDSLLSFAFPHCAEEVQRFAVCTHCLRAGGNDASHRFALADCARSSTLRCAVGDVDVSSALVAPDAVCELDPLAEPPTAPADVANSVLLPLPAHASIRQRLLADLQRLKRASQQCDQLLAVRGYSVERGSDSDDDDDNSDSDSDGARNEQIRVFYESTAAKNTNLRRALFDAEQLARLRCDTTAQLLDSVRWCTLTEGTEVVVEKMHRDGKSIVRERSSSRRIAVSVADLAMSSLPFKDVPWCARLSVALDVARAVRALHASVPLVRHGGWSSRSVHAQQRADGGGGIDARLKVTLAGDDSDVAWSYTAPEVLRPAAASTSSELCCSEPADVYRLSMLMFELVMRRKPFVGIERFRLHASRFDRAACINAIVGVQQLRPSLDDLDAERDPLLKRYAALIESCWHADPAKRPSAETVADKLDVLVAAEDRAAASSSSTASPASSSLTSLASGDMLTDSGDSMSWMAINPSRPSRAQLLQWDSIDMAEYVQCMAVSSDGESVWIGLSSGVVHRWPASGKADEALSVRVSKSDRIYAMAQVTAEWLVVCTDSGAIHVVEQIGGGRGSDLRVSLAPTQPHRATMVKAMVLLDDERMLTGDVAGKLVLWCRATMHVIGERQLGEERPILSMCLAASRELIIELWVGSRGQLVRVQVDSHQSASKSVATMAAHDGTNINAVVTTPFGTVWSAGDDAGVRVWNTETLKCVDVITLHNAKVFALCSLGRFVLSGAFDQRIIIFDGDSHNIVQQLTGHADSVRCFAALSSDHVWSGSRDRTICVWRRS